jgi:hypothetical protein
MTSADFDAAFAALKSAFGGHEDVLVVGKDSPAVYSLLSQKTSPFKQHKGAPMWFGEVRLGKAYASFHLMPLYTNPALLKLVSSSLIKRLQGKSCFNFKTAPEPETLKELKHLVGAAVKDWLEKDYL